MRPSFLIGALIVAIGIILISQYWPEPTPLPVPTPVVPSTEPPSDQDLDQTMPAVQSEPIVIPDDATPTSPAPVAPPLPKLEESDEFVRQQVGAWSLPAVWLQQNDLLARAAVLLQNAADGQVPRSQLAFLAVGEPYEVAQRGEQFFVEPASYARYDWLVNALEKIPPADLAAFVKLVSPRLVDGLALLGERRSPSELLGLAATRIAQLPELPIQVELLRPNVMYTYADPELEGLADFDKQMLRFGPENLSRIKSYLSEFKKNYQLK